MERKSLDVFDGTVVGHPAAPASSGRRKKVESLWSVLSHRYGWASEITPRGNPDAGCRQRDKHPT
eukprot:scaffold105643_cov32-Tisochrysis_lutea.AAC.2